MILFLSVLLCTTGLFAVLSSLTWPRHALLRAFSIGAVGSLVIACGSLAQGDGASSLTLSIFDVLSPIVIAGLSWLSVKLSQLITAKVKNEYLRGALVRLNDAVLTAIKSIQQTIVDDIKSASEDGKVTPEEIASIQRNALQRVKAYLGLKGLAELASVLGLSGAALDTFLTSKIESAVYDLKQASVPPHPLALAT